MKLSMEMIGNKALLNYTKIGFLASSHIDVAEVMTCYEWSSKKQEPKTAVMSGFSSKMEKDMLHFLLKAHTPIIWVLARKPYKDLTPKLQATLNDNLLLIISASNAPQQSKENAYKCNEYIASTADKLIFTGVAEASSLFPLFQKYKEKSTP